MVRVHPNSEFQVLNFSVFEINIPILEFPNNNIFEESINFIHCINVFQIEVFSLPERLSEL